MKAYCNLPFTRMKIDADGVYQSCCHQRTYYGNLLTDNITIEEAFSGNQLREVKNSVMTKKLHSSCNNTHCPMFFTELERNVDVELGKLPIQIELNLPSTWCNIGGISPTPETACIMCPRSSKKFMRTENIDNTDRLLEIIKPVISSLEALSILGIAEPFWKGKVFDILDTLEFKKYKENITFWTFTNGTIFNKKVQDRFIDEYTSYTSLGFSIDAGNSTTYKKIRRLDYYKTIERNVEQYFNKVNSHSEKRDWSFISHNINLLNVGDMTEMIRFANSIGANKVLFNLTYISTDGISIPLNYLCNQSNWEIFWEAQQQAEQLGKELNQHIEFYVPFHKGFLK